MSSISKQAVELASKSQITITFRDKVTDGDEYIYLAINPQLQGCIAQGDTPEEALENLNEVRTYWFEHLLEHGLPIPETDIPESIFTKARFFLSSDQLTEEIEEPDYRVLEVA